MADHCCEAFAENTGSRNEGFERLEDGSWAVNGCCHGGCFVLVEVRFCPFCGSRLPTVEEGVVVAEATVVDWRSDTFGGAVDVDPNRCGGRPVLRGTRFTVAQVLAELADSAGPSEVADAVDLDEADVRSVLRGLSVIVEALK